MNLPPDWAQAPLRELAEVITKGTTPTTLGFEYLSRGIPFVKVENLSNGRINPDTITGFISQEANEKLSRSQLKSRDVLVSIAGTIGRVATVSDADLPANTNQAVGIVRGVDQIFNPKYLRYFFEAPQSQAQLQPAARGGAMNNISLTDLGNLETAIAPLREQDRIVAEIEKQFTRLDDAVAALKRVQANLKRYCASVLNAACQGRLVPTEAELARKEGRDYEPASQLLKRTLAERRAKWETDQLRKMVAAAKPPKNDEWKKRYAAPLAPEQPEPAELPEGWAWAGLEQVVAQEPNALKAGPFGSALKKEFYVSQGYKIYGQEQVIRGDAYFGDYYIDEGRFQLLRSCAIKPGDVLVSLVGTAGKILILPNDCEPGIINPRLIKIALNPTVMSAPYFKLLMESPQTQHFFKLHAHGETMDVLNLSTLRKFPLPLPPRPEQDRIADEVEHQLSISCALEIELRTRHKMTTQLRTAILRQAFSGKLVPQDPNDEPASVLLERIRAERARTQAENEKTPKPANGAASTNG